MRTVSSLDYLPYFVKIKVSLCDHHALCTSVYPPINFLNLYETWYVYHST
jgi:hypothetical protein